MVTRATPAVGAAAVILTATTTVTVQGVFHRVPTHAEQALDWAAVAVFSTVVVCVLVLTAAAIFAAAKRGGFCLSFGAFHVRLSFGPSPPDVATPEISLPAHRAGASEGGEAAPTHATLADDGVADEAAPVTASARAGPVAATAERSPTRTGVRSRPSSRRGR
jgi:hypothetical protein